MNITDTIKNASSSQSAHNPFGSAKMTKQPTKPTDMAALTICDDPIPTKRASSADKYGAIFNKMNLGQAIKCSAADCGKVSKAMRKYIVVNLIDAKVVSTSDYGDGMARVWMVEK